MKSTASDNAYNNGNPVIREEDTYLTYFHAINSGAARRGATEYVAYLMRMNEIAAQNAALYCSSAGGTQLGVAANLHK